MLAKKVVGKSEKYVKELFLLLSYQPVARYLLVAGVSDNLHRETFVTLLRNFGENFIGFAYFVYLTYVLSSVNNTLATCTFCPKL